MTEARTNGHPLEGEEASSLRRASSKSEPDNQQVYMSKLSYQKGSELLTAQLDNVQEYWLGRANSLETKYDELKKLRSCRLIQAVNDAVYDVMIGFREVRDSYEALWKANKVEIQSLNEEISQGEGGISQGEPGIGPQECGTREIHCQSGETDLRKRESSLNHGRTNGVSANSSQRAAPSQAQRNKRYVSGFQFQGTCTGD